MREKLNYKNLNELIQTGKVLLKIGLIVAITGLIVLGVFILEKTKVLNILGKIIGIMLPLFIGLCVAWLFEPLIKKLESKNISRVLSTVIVYLSFVLIFILLLVLVVPEFVIQLKDLIAQIPSFFAEIQDFIVGLISKFGNSEMDIETIKSNIILQLEDFSKNLTSNSLTGVLNGITTFITEGFNFILGVLIGFYLSLDFKKVSSGMNSVIPLRHKKTFKEITQDLDGMARGYVSGTLFTSLIVAFLSFLGFLIAGVSSPLLFSVFCGVTNIIPYFGPYIGGIPVVIVGFSINPMCGIISLITIVLVQFVEGNIINPLIVGKAVDIHPVTIMISLLIFQYFFGITGMIFATPIVGALKIVFMFFNKKYQLLNRITTSKIEIN